MATPIFTSAADRTPGSLIEEKAAGLAWHYRAADPEYGTAQANLSRHPDALVMALGDDRTDEAMFAALPRGGMAIHVGVGDSRAPHRLRDIPEVRWFLQALAAREEPAFAGGQRAVL